MYSQMDKQMHGSQQNINDQRRKRILITCGELQQETSTRMHTEKQTSQSCSCSITFWNRKKQRESISKNVLNVYTGDKRLNQRQTCPEQSRKGLEYRFLKRGWVCDTCPVAFDGTREVMFKHICPATGGIQPTLSEHVTGSAAPTVYTGLCKTRSTPVVSSHLSKHRV